MSGRDGHYNDTEGSYHIVDVAIENMSPMDMQIIMRLEAYPKGLLRIKVIHEEERVRFWYTISSMVPISDILKRKKFNAVDICNLLLPLIALSDFLDSFLLDARNLRLEESCIYYDFKAECLMLMYLPVKDPCGIVEKPMDLLEFIKDLVFKQINYSDDSSADATGILTLLGKLRACDDLGNLKTIILNTTVSNSSSQNLVVEDNQQNINGSDVKSGSIAGIRIESGTFESTRPVESSRPVAEKKNDDTIKFMPGAKSDRKRDKGTGSKGDIGILIKRSIVFVACMALITAGLKYLDKLDVVNLSIALSIAGLTPFVFVKSKMKTSVKSEKKEPEKGIAKNQDQLQIDQLQKRLSDERKSHMQPVVASRPVARPNETQLIQRSAERIILKPKNISHGMIEVTAKSCLIGRTPDLSDYVLDYDTIGRLHAEIIYDDSGFIIKDFNTLNGTFVNHHRVSPGETVRLKQGDAVSFADVEFVVM